MNELLYRKKTVSLSWEGGGRGSTFARKIEGNACQLHRRGEHLLLTLERGGSATPGLKNSL